MTRAIATAASIALLAGLLMAPAAQALPTETGTVAEEPAPAPVEPAPVDQPVDPVPGDTVPADPAPADPTVDAQSSAEVTPAETGPAEVAPTEAAPAAPENISLPLIEGDPVVGGTLTSTGGQWTGAGWVQYSWIIDGVTVQTAGHAVGEADVLNILPTMAAKSVQLSVVASSDAQTPGTEVSAAAVTVRSRRPSLGYLEQHPGRQACCGAGAVLRHPAVGRHGRACNCRYQWFRGTAAIAAATTARYTVTPTDVGQKLWAKVTLSAPGFTSVELSSVQVTGVSATFSTSPVPTVSGKARVGQVQTANPGTWAPTGAALSYQWYRGTAAIAGAVSYRYTTTAADYGKALKVRVRATKAGFVTVDRSPPHAPLRRDRSSPPSPLW